MSFFGSPKRHGRVGRLGGQATLAAHPKQYRRMGKKSQKIWHAHGAVPTAGKAIIFTPKRVQETRAQRKRRRSR